MRPLRRFLYVLLCLTVYVICLWVFFPHKQSPCNLLSKDDYMGYLHYETSDFYEKYDAKSILIKDISFNFDMEVPIDFTSISYDFMIIRQGVIYKGPFKENITVKDVPFIMDNNLTRANTVAFILLDHTNKQVYKWYNDDTYFLYKKDKYYITLQENGEFLLSNSPFIRRIQRLI